MENSSRIQSSGGLDMSSILTSEAHEEGHTTDMTTTASYQLPAEKVSSPIHPQNQKSTKESGPPTRQSIPLELKRLLDASKQTQLNISLLMDSSTSPTLPSLKTFPLKEKKSASPKHQKIFSSDKDGASSSASSEPPPPPPQQQQQQQRSSRPDPDLTSSGQEADTEFSSSITKETGSPKRQRPLLRDMEIQTDESEPEGQRASKKCKDVSLGPSRSVSPIRSRPSFRSSLRREPTPSHQSLKSLKPAPPLTAAHENSCQSTSYSHPHHQPSMSLCPLCSDIHPSGSSLSSQPSLPPALPRGLPFSSPVADHHPILEPKADSTYLKRDESYLLDKETSMLKPLADIVFDLFMDEDSDLRPRKLGRAGGGVTFASQLESPIKGDRDRRRQRQDKRPAMSLDDVSLVIETLNF